MYSRNLKPPCIRHGSSLSEAMRLQMSFSLARTGVPLNLAKLPSTGAPFRAEAIHDHGYLLISRILVTKGPRNSFVVNPNRLTVTVAPPKPFSGKAEFQICPARSSL